MEDNDVRKIIFDCLDNEAFVAKLKLKLFNLEGLKSQADFDEQINKVNELENEKQGYEKTISDLNNKVTEFESANEELRDKLEQVKAQYHNDESKLEQYRSDVKSYLTKVEEQEKEIGELESENKKLQAQLTEVEGHFKTASAESIKNLQRATELEEKLKQYEEGKTKSKKPGKK